MEVKGFEGCLSYVDCCPNQPEHGKAFCTVHCEDADKEGIPKVLKDYKGI